MKKQPTLKTERLILRPFKMSDATEVRRLAGDKEIASTTLAIPHPYQDTDAPEWIGTHQEKFHQGEMATFAIVLPVENVLIGAIDLNIDRKHERAELGYWIGKPYWNNGYVTEAGRRIIRYGFEELGLNRIFAKHMTRNPSSGRVMEKAGMKYEGCLRQEVKKWGKFEDLNVYSILKSEFKAEL
jgi:RimJ/RimL family protein N-acetyltransferase